jgi:hypothetical protein
MITMAWQGLLPCLRASMFKSFRIRSLAASYFRTRQPLIRLPDEKLQFTLLIGF